MTFCPNARRARRPGLGLLFYLLPCWVLGVPIALAGDLVVQLPAVADTGLFETSPTNNLGAATNVPAGVHSGAKRSRYLLRFAPESALPPDAEIVAVELLLGIRDANATPVTYALHRMLVPWNEGDKSGNNGSPATYGETTWLARAHPDTLWSAPGAAAGAGYGETASAHQILDGANTNVTLSSAAMAADVQRWLDDPGTNLGWLLKAVDESVPQTARRICSRESTNTPQLVLRYHLGPQLQISNSGPGQLQLSFTARPNRAYALESRTFSNTGDWQLRTNFAPQPIATIQVFPDNPTNTQFYRARVPPH